MHHYCILLLLIRLVPESEPFFGTGLWVLRDKKYIYPSLLKLGQDTRPGVPQNYIYWTMAKLFVWEWRFTLWRYGLALHSVHVYR